jgi:pimeloyl-ACP methyl ester carboxylesterase
MKPNQKTQNTNRLVFPIFNLVVCAAFGWVIGYYVFLPLRGILLGGLAGLTIGLLAETVFGQPGLASWFYRRRVLLIVLLEIPITVFVFGPYAYVLVETRPNHHQVCCETPLDIGAETYEDVRIEADDGIILAGWYIPPQEVPGPVIVVLHGSGGDRRNGMWHARELLAAGYGVLLYDQRALGESTGEQTSFGWFDGADLLIALEWLNGRSEVDPERIGAVGLSLGGQIVVNAAYQAPDRLAAIWLDGIGAQQIADFPEPENLGERFATLINALILKMAEIHLSRAAPPAFVEILPRLDRPQIVLVGAGQQPFEERITQKYAGLTGPNAQVWLIEEAYHTGGPITRPAEYRERMLAFFGDALLH